MLKLFLIICLTLIMVLQAAAEKFPAQIEWRDLDGIAHQPLNPEKKSGTVLIFFWHDCPISNSYAPEINRMAASYTNFSFYIVQVDPDLNAEAAKQHAKEFSLRAPVLLDPKHRLVKLAKASITPEAVVFGKSDGVLYRGCIDNRFASLSKKRAEPTQRDLRDALDLIAGGKPVKIAETKAIGCAIQNEK